MEMIIYITSRRDGRMTKWLLDETLKEIKDGKTSLVICYEGRAIMYERYFQEAGVNVEKTPYYFQSAKDKIYRALGFPHKPPVLQGYYFKLKRDENHNND